tara:strand:- start:1874 stop:2047 length:174 start_codon:yes stop_codon:yes gene_type:complete
MSDFKPFLVRLSPTNVVLLDQAKIDLEKSKTAIVNDAIKAYLAKGGTDIHARLNRLG